MGLREDLAASARTFIEDEAGFGWPVQVTTPLGETTALVGLTTDITNLIDPETGIAISGRMASLTLPIGALTDAGLGLPIAQPEKTQRPWLVRFADVGGKPHLFAVREAKPDRAMGVVVLMLEAYRDSTGEDPIPG